MKVGKAEEKLLAGLNEAQREAVIYTEGTSLVLAGAGSGKTRALTAKVALLLCRGVEPGNVLALTFTNKAAGEMKSRVGALVGMEAARRLWMGTFHSVFARILRMEAEKLGFPSHFSIYDAGDTRHLLSVIVRELGLDDKAYRAAAIQSRISQAKNALYNYNTYAQKAELMEEDKQRRMPMLHEVFRQYANRLRQADALDFDDLLLQTYVLFRDNEEVLEKYHNVFRYVLVDEYQDTNYVQHCIIGQLCSGGASLTVVGDDAQSIYSFRGANIENILGMPEAYPACKVFRLERNYRSTRHIVDAANSLIGKNRNQLPKRVYSEREEGAKLEVVTSFSDREEAERIGGSINEQLREGVSCDAFAVLYRTNAQSRVIEESLRKRSIPYRIYGGLSFYQRKEIKDVLAWFRVLLNPSDEEALQRALHFPSRGIGDTTLEKLKSAALKASTGMWTVLQEPEAYGVAFNKGTLGKLAGFGAVVLRLQALAVTAPADEVAAAVVKESGIYALLLEDTSAEGLSRRENTEELMKGLGEFVERRRNEGEESALLADFLSEVALLTDRIEEEDGIKEKVTLLTVHAAKGLEFRRVFVAGLEEDLFPSLQAKDSPRALEEERRLLYVAITRAEERCVLSYAQTRFIHGKQRVSSPSRFLKDIDARYLTK